jgi:hypothetical protein
MTDMTLDSFLANLIATVFMLLNLNSIMSVVFNVPAAIASTVSQCSSLDIRLSEIIFDRLSHAAQSVV